MRFARRTTCTAVLVLLAAALPSLAQNEEVFDLFKPQLTLSGEGAGARGFRKDEEPYVDAAEDEFQWRSATLNMNIPLGGAHLHPEGRLLGHQLFLHAVSAGSRADLSFLREGQADLFAGGLGFTALMLGQSRNLYAASLFATIAEERETLDEPEIRYSGLGLGSFRTEGALWIYGGAFTYTFGRPRLLPVFGGWGKVGPDWTLAGIVPFLFQARYKPAQAWHLDLFLKVLGNQFRYANLRESPGGPREFPGEDEDLQLRIVQGRLGAGMSRSFGKSFTLSGEIGTLFARNVAFAGQDESRPFLRAVAEPAGYARLILRFSFGDSILDRDLP